MISLKKEGNYELSESKHDTKILRLGPKAYLWPYAQGIGEILVASDEVTRGDHVLAVGAYRLYKVLDEPKLTDLEHLELSVGQDKWQGYLLLTGLPSGKKLRSRIIPTKEIISK